MNLGLLHTLAKYWVGKHISDNEPIKAIKSAHIFKGLLSSLDTISDIAVAITLFQQEDYSWAFAVLAIDYAPAWQVLLHGITSPAWKKVKDFKEKAMTGAILLLAPIASPLFKLRLLWGYSNKTDDLFEYNHQNERLSELITSSVESPLQLVMMLMLISYGKIPMPWNETSILEDGVGNSINLGALPGLFSLVMSVLSLIISSLDVAECRNWKERAAFGSYAFCNGLFRIGSLVILLTLFWFWTLIGLLPLLCFASITAIMRFDPDGRNHFSALTTFLVALFLPVAVSAEPQKAQYPQQEEVENERIIKNRMSVSGKISLFTLPIILVFDVILFLLLFSDKLKLDCSLVLGVDDAKNISITVLYLFIIPIGVAAMLSGYILSTRSTRKTTLAALATISIAVLALSVYAPVHVFKGNFIRIKQL